MNTEITIRLDETLDQMLNTVSTQTGQSRSDIVRSALRRQLSVILFEQLRERQCHLQKQQDISRMKTSFRMFHESIFGYECFGECFCNTWIVS